MVNLKNDVSSSNPDSKSLIKHMFFSSLLSYKRKFKEKEVIICCDDKSYWRRDYFPQYKGCRKEAREKSDMDWDVIFETIEELKVDLKTYFPYKVIGVPGAEADDVIACISKHLQTNDLIQVGLFDFEPKPIIIISADGDLVQLQKYSNVTQWSQMQKKNVKAKGSLQKYVVEHIVKGDPGDGVPNILSSDSSLVDHIRQKPIRQSFLNKFYSDGIDACENEEQRQNFIRNQTLVDFGSIPDRIYNAVVKEYESYEVIGSKSKIMTFFVKNKMKNLLENLNEF